MPSIFLSHEGESAMQRKQHRYVLKIMQTTSRISKAPSKFSPLQKGNISFTNALVLPQP